MIAATLIITTFAGLAVLFGLCCCAAGSLIADVIEGARYQREVEARDAARHARARARADRS